MRPFWLENWAFAESIITNQSICKYIILLIPLDLMNFSVLENGFHTEGGGLFPANRPFWRGPVPFQRDNLMLEDCRK